MQNSANGAKRLMYRVTEVAEMLGVSRAYVYVLINQGRMPAVRLGKNGARIPCEALRRWIEENTKQEAA